MSVKIYRPRMIEKHWVFIGGDIALAMRRKNGETHIGFRYVHRINAVVFLGRFFPPRADRVQSGFRGEWRIYRQADTAYRSALQEIGKEFALQETRSFGRFLN